MERTLTIRQAAQRLNVSVPQARRWLLAALGPDPLAGRQMGVARTLEEHELLALWFMRHFILEQKCGVDESGKWTFDIVGFLYNRDWIPNPPIGEVIVQIHAERNILEFWHYQKVHRLETDWHEGAELLEITAQRIWYPPEKIDTAPRGPVIVVPISMLLAEFNAKVSLGRTLKGWWNLSRPLSTLTTQRRRSCVKCRREGNADNGW